VVGAGLTSPWRIGDKLDLEVIIVQNSAEPRFGTVERIKNVARRCLATQRQGHKVAVIVSAMSGETNRLLGLAQPDARRA